MVFDVGHVWETGGVHRGCWWGNLRERDHLKDLGVDGRIILIQIFKKWDGEVGKQMSCSD